MTTIEGQQVVKVITPQRRQLITWPFVGFAVVLGLAVIYNWVFWGEGLANPIGYLIPAGVGLLSGFLCAIWFRRSCFYLNEAVSRETRYAKLSKRYELILQSTEEGIYEIDRDGICLFINQAALTALGYREEELLGQNIHELICCGPDGSRSIPLADCPIHNATAESHGVRVPDDFKARKDGSLFIADTLAYPVKENEAEGIVVMFRDVTAERKLQKRVHYMANFDKLTGLQNRYAFEESLKLALSGAHREQRCHALCYIDIDQFKVINDTMGHVAGDAMLKAFSEYLTKHVRKDDILGRLGGDEFGLLLCDCQADDTHKIVQKLQDQVKRFLFQWEGVSFQVGLSIGVCCLDRQVTDITQALKWADQACLIAKESGRNRYQFYSPDDLELQALNEQMNWVALVNKALQEDLLYLRYQPIRRLTANENEYCQFEILVSMRDQTGRDMAPGSFLPAAERYGLMTLVDRWVLRTSFAWLDANTHRQDSFAFVSINLSGASICDDTFLDFALQELANHSFPAHKICFEITETAAMQQMYKASHFIAKLKKSGCRFALDDFGSGMASFGYLKNFPVDFIKIDGSFVTDMATNPLSREIVDSISRVARVMNIATVAEHAEDHETLHILEEIGVDYVQGYIVARPAELSGY